MYSLLPFNMGHRLISQTEFVFLITIITEKKHVCAIVNITPNYMLMYNRKIVTHLKLCLVNSTGHI